jgi:hypothetical protein
VAALAGAALVAGVVASAPAGGQGQGAGTAEYRDARADLNRTLAAYRENVVYRVFDDRPATLARMRGHVAGFEDAVDRLEDLERSGDAPLVDAVEITDLREAHEHMEDYLAAVAEDDRFGMQVTTWRFLWVLNRLPIRR